MTFVALLLVYAYYNCVRRFEPGLLQASKEERDIRIEHTAYKI